MLNILRPVVVKLRLNVRVCVGGIPGGGGGGGEVEGRPDPIARQYHFTRASALYMDIWWCSNGAFSSKLEPFIIIT